jgi:hypothetical protein
MQPITAFADELEIGRLANAARVEIIRRDSPFEALRYRAQSE